FDTPERRADLEHRLKSLLRQVGDESVRRHYLQDADERLRSFFAGRGAHGGGRERGTTRGRREDRTAPSGRGAAGGGRRSAISDRLARSSLTRPRRVPEPSLREIAIVLGFVNHPVLIHEAFDYFADLDLPEGDLDRLRSSVLDVYAEAPPADREALLAELARRGTREIFDVHEAKARQVRLWPFLADAAAEDAREAVRQALHLQHRSRSLSLELKNAEEALGHDSSEASFAHLLEVKREIERVDGTEALIDGFGTLSGRPAKAI
ncbi:MAG TPA: DNA primase, partial [Aurantimonas sp.]